MCSQATIPHPLDPTKPDVPGSCVVLVATIDGVLRLFRFANFKEAAGLARQPQPVPVDTPTWILELAAAADRGIDEEDSEPSVCSPSPPYHGSYMQPPTALGVSPAAAAGAAAVARAAGAGGDQAQQAAAVSLPDDGFDESSELEEEDEDDDEEVATQQHQQDMDGRPAHSSAWGSEEGSESGEVVNQPASK